MRLGPPVYPEEPPAGEYVEICVADDGAGMTDDVRAKVFEPFFTTKEIGKGSGLGLSQVLGFVKQAGGGVRIQSRLSEGTKVHIYLPHAQATSSQASPAPAAARAAPPADATILLVDDDDAVREITAAILADLGYDVVEAHSGAAALQDIQEKAEIDLLLIDFGMPGMNGAELARRARVARRDLPCSSSPASPTAPRLPASARRGSF